ncbi:hypothetical protein G4B88_012940 [Cannabis sativa]|uniref:RNase H type-1 domain-containing protein n=1 Tax=Cannabis sativa TaxID=3483 RepID=A0A7J6DJT2_CANSA|nr:hypothetical protein G4B88_012940 [Cannabis sativa]
MDKTCSMCGEAIESNTHLFWDCPCARALWFSSPFSIRGGIGSDWANKEILEWLLDRIPTEHCAAFLSFMGFLFDGIWKARNELIFKGGVVNIQQLRNAIMRRYSESLLVMEMVVISDATNPGLAVGLLDRARNTTEWFAKQVVATSATEAELLAIQWAMQLAAQRGFKVYAGASDAKVVIDALKKRRCPPIWQLKPLALEVLNLCKRQY